MDHRDLILIIFHRFRVSRDSSILHLNQEVWVDQTHSFIF